MDQSRNYFRGVGDSAIYFAGGIVLAPFGGAEIGRPAFSRSRQGVMSRPEVRGSDRRTEQPDVRTDSARVFDGAEP